MGEGAGRACPADLVRRAEPCRAVRIARHAGMRHAMCPDEAFGLIFSWDNVVADTRALQLAAWRRVAADEGLPFPELARPAMFGMRPERVVTEARGPVAWPPWWWIHLGVVGTLDCFGRLWRAGGGRRPVPARGDGAKLEGAPGPLPALGMLRRGQAGEQRESRPMSPIPRCHSAGLTLGGGLPLRRPRPAGAAVDAGLEAGAGAGVARRERVRTAAAGGGAGAREHRGRNGVLESWSPAVWIYLWNLSVWIYACGVQRASTPPSPPAPPPAQAAQQLGWRPAESYKHSRWRGGARLTG